MSTIENLYYGNIYLFEHKIEPDSKELLKLLCWNEKNLTKSLKKEQVEELEKYQAKIPGLIECKAFNRGFILAVCIMSEAMQEMMYKKL